MGDAPVFSSSHGDPVFRVALPKTLRPLDAIVPNDGHARARDFTGAGLEVFFNPGRQRRSLPFLSPRAVPEQHEK